MYSRLLVIRWRTSGKSRSQQEIKAIYPSTLQMMYAVLISVIFYSSMAEGWPVSNWRFWSNPFLIVPNAPIITGTIFVLTFHILLISISRSLYFFVFQFLWCQRLNQLLRPYRSVGKSSRSTVTGLFASIVRSVVTGTSHIIVVLLTFMTLSGICS